MSTALLMVFALTNNLTRHATHLETEKLEFRVLFLTITPRGNNVCDLGNVTYFKTVCISISN